MATTRSILHSPAAFQSLILLLLAAFTSSALQSFVSPSSPENSTLSALLQFKGCIDGDPNGSLSSWDPSLYHFCEWQGIVCANTSHHVEVPNLSSAFLGGTLSSSIGNLQGLSCLDLSLCDLTGEVPTELSNLAPSLSPHSKKNLALLLACVVGAISLLASVYVLWRLLHKRGKIPSDFVVPQYKVWTTEEMRMATNYFNASNVIGSGAMSMCYLGVMKIPEGERIVAFKRLILDDYIDEGDDEGRKCFVNEFKTLYKLRHRNLIKVLGYCVEGSEIALVMEYLEKGDLDRQLHNEANSLSWEERVNVAMDVAEGLVYLHHEYGEPIIHCDIKPKNILLSCDMVPKISDFGLAKLLKANEAGDKTMSRLRGTFGYIAPECGLGLKISVKADVYNNGVLLLELVSGVGSISPMLDEEVMSVRAWAERLLAFGRIREELGYNDAVTLQEAKKLVRLGVQCCHDVAKERPTMYTIRDSIVQLIKQRRHNDRLLLPSTNPHRHNQQFTVQALSNCV